MTIRSLSTTTITILYIRQHDVLVLDVSSTFFQLLFEIEITISIKLTQTYIKLNYINCTMTKLQAQGRYSALSTPPPPYTHRYGRRNPVKGVRVVKHPRGRRATPYGRHYNYVSRGTELYWNLNCSFYALPFDLIFSTLN